ncbi:MAG: phage holin family protein [Candidatus Rokubacteria bacterium]|nr:phage holin family protein [Candidatus Rokubacteria bacterium]
MLYLIAHWVVSALCLMLVTHLVSGFRVAGFGTALVAALVIGLINATLGFLLKIVTFPLTILTFGLFLLVINAIVLWLASALVPGFEITGFWPALLAAAILALVGMLLRRLLLS